MFELDGVFIIDGTGPLPGALPASLARYDDFEALIIVKARANELSKYALHGEGFRPNPVLLDAVSPATKRWADLVEERTGSRPTDFQASQQLDKLARFFIALKEADLDNHR